jgi:hypothetical protein
MNQRNDEGEDQSENYFGTEGGERGGSHSGRGITAHLPAKCTTRLTGLKQCNDGQRTVSLRGLSMYPRHQLVSGRQLLPNRIGEEPLVIRRIQS